MEARPPLLRAAPVPLPRRRRPRRIQRPRRAASRKSERAARTARRVESEALSESGSTPDQFFGLHFSHAAPRRQMISRITRLVGASHLLRLLSLLWPIGLLATEFPAADWPRATPAQVGMAEANLAQA